LTNKNELEFEKNNFNYILYFIYFLIIYNKYKIQNCNSLILNMIYINLLLYMARCPYCEQVIDLGQLKTEEFEDGDLLFKFLGLSCPKCEKILKIQKID
jgi:hypothetical protein